MSNYTVKKGDYLIRIAREKGVTLQQLMEANPQISNPNLIHPGQSINVPDTQYAETDSSDGLYPPDGVGGNNYNDEEFRTMDEMGSPFAEKEEEDESDTENEVVDSPSPPPLKRFIKGKHGRSWTELRSEDWFGNITEPFKEGNDGTKEKTLIEPVPKYFSRPGDGIITATGFKEGSADNNTMIIMGRDRTGEKEIDSADKDLRKSDSGYSTYMGAGAIDIVVGRCSPFPMNIEGKSWSPIFNTTKKDPELFTEVLEGVDEGEPFFTFHPGYAMDAARIYISQMTDVDENFRIQKELYPSRTVKKKNKRTPCSGIVLKSDKIRLHARQDIKIVTKGPYEKVNSQGNDITETGGIHLIAGNGSKGYQQPIPKGDNLATVIDELADKVDHLAGIVFSFVDSQMKFNKTMGTHVHQSPFKGIPTTPSITAGPHSVETVLSQFGRVSTQIVFLKHNLAMFKNRYLEYGCAEFINSEFNTTN